jgi:hypothetical protein
VRVPEEAGFGKAKVTFSFAAWESATVASSTIEIPIVEPEEMEKEDQVTAP